MNWVRYFERNRRYRPLVPWELGVALQPGVRAPLVRSLQHFQAGERGTGAHLLEAAERHGDIEYAEALFLFIGEEQEHARLLGRILHALGAEPLCHYWGSRAFTFLRRLAGLRGELFVLLTAEIIGARYYCALYEALPDPALRAAFGQILRDEEAHLAFHRESLHRLCRNVPRLLRPLLAGSLHVFFRVVCLVAAVDLRGVLSAVGVTPLRFVRECGYLYAEALTAIFERPARSANARGQARPTAAPVLTLDEARRLSFGERRSSLSDARELEAAVS